MKWQISTVAGIVVIALYCVFTFLSWALYPTTCSPIKNWLSDLGNSTGNPDGAILYNLGCILTGIALFPFFVGLYKWYTTERWRKTTLIAGQIVGFAAAFALMMIGVFSEDEGSLHVLWSNIFFLLNLVVLLLTSVSFATHPRSIKAIPAYGFLVAIINLAFIFVSGTPLLEWFTVFTALGYVGLLGYNMTRL